MSDGSPFYFLRQHLSLSLGLVIQFGWLASVHQAYACLHLLSTGISSVQLHIWLFVSESHT